MWKIKALTSSDNELQKLCDQHCFVVIMYLEVDSDRVFSIQNYI